MRALILYFGGGGNERREGGWERGKEGKPLEELSEPVILAVYFKFSDGEKNLRESKEMLCRRYLERSTRNGCTIYAVVESM